MERDQMSSVKFRDVNGDERADLIYTGPNGLNILLFSASTFSFVPSSSNPDEIKQAHKSLNVLEVLQKQIAGLNHSLIIFQDVNYQLVFAEFKPKITTNLSPIAPFVAASISPTSSNATNRPRLVANNKKFTISQREFSNRYLSWFDTWDSNVFQSAVDISKGRLNFKLDIYEHPFIGSPLAFEYNSQVKLENLLGRGWNINLQTSYIKKAPKRINSVFNNEILTVLNLDGQLFLLKPQLNGNQHTFTIKNFGPTITNNVTVTGIFNPVSETWVVDSPTARLVFGARPNSIVYSLSWKKWCCTGNDTQSLMRSPLIWYVTSYEDKSSKKTLTYDYKWITG